MALEEFSQLEAITPIDGRSREITKGLTPYFSWLAQNRYRVWVELEYLRRLSEELGSPLGMEEMALVETIPADFSIEDAENIWKIYQDIRHDLKAVEIYLHEKLKGTALEKRIPWLHFGITTEDLQYIAFAVGFRDFLQELYIPKIKNVKETLAELAGKWKEVPMIGRTHGQAAVPTTVGKEIINFAVALHQSEKKLADIKFYGKLSGAVGNFNAHVAAYPNIDWIAFSRKFVAGFGLEPLLWTTQIPRLDFLVTLLDHVRLVNNILIGFARDMWRYISDGYFTLAAGISEVDSSTMPQKINPVDFEGAEANFSSSNGILENLSRLLPINRLQRDLTDRYLIRDIGPAMGYAWIGLEYLLRGLGKIEVNQEKVKKDLDSHWEVLAEAVQTILRSRGGAGAYEMMRKLTQGKTLDRSQYLGIIQGLAISDDVKQKLASLTPETYLGKAVELTEQGIQLCSS